MKRTLFLLLGLIVLSGCATVEEKEYVQQREDIVRKTVLNNGVSIITKEVHNKVISFQIWFKTGSRTEDDVNNGISHFIEHLIFKGSTKRKSNDLSKEIESVGGRLNGGTSKDYTYYYFTIAKKFFDIGLEGMMDCVLNPLFDEKELEKERDVVVEEISRQKDNPNACLFNLVSEASYENHPYKRPVIGKEKIIKSVSKETISKYYSENYVPENMIIVIVGDFDTGKMIKKIRQYFLTFNKKELKVNPKVKAVFSQAKLVEQTNFQQCYMALSWLAPDVDNEDTYAMDVLATSLGQGRSSRLYRELKEKQQLCYSIGASYSTMKDEGLFVVYSELDGKNSDILEKNVIEEISRIKENGITISELNKVKTMIENNYIFDHETNEEIASSLGYYEVISSYKLELSYIDSIRQVSLDDIKRTANKYLKDKYSLVVLKAKDSIQK